MCTRLESMLSTFTSVVRNFRLSLPNHYDPDRIAAYCDHRPHVLIFRLLEWHSHFQPDLISLVLKLPRAAGLAAPFPSDEAVAIIEEEFGWSLRNIFAYLSMEPAAAASFGQVCRGCTIDGLEVAVKAVI
ncbi:unnamed protein product [Sphagnum jensenii]|uniref:ABC1 atypical kinase-like domain-containing protein n=1 Tax=Sphagnum jensenii TaxID=128206 RepID=A0ABP1AKN9_9BRYO